MKAPYVAAAAAVWLAPVSAAFAQPGSGPWDHTMPMMGWGGWWMGPVMMILVITLVVLAIIGLWRLLSGGGSSRSAPASDRALDLLRERFARGEIDDVEYQSRKKALGG